MCRSYICTIYVVAAQYIDCTLYMLDKYFVTTVHIKYTNFIFIKTTDL